MMLSAEMKIFNVDDEMSFQGNTVGKITLAPRGRGGGILSLALGMRNFCFSTSNSLLLIMF